MLSSQDSRLGSWDCKAIRVDTTQRNDVILYVDLYSVLCIRNGGNGEPGYEPGRGNPGAEADGKRHRAQAPMTATATPRCLRLSLNHGCLKASTETVF
jgi:hypothetical protein